MHASIADRAAQIRNAIGSISRPFTHRLAYLGCILGYPNRFQKIVNFVKRQPACLMPILVDVRLASSLTVDEVVESALWLVMPKALPSLLSPDILSVFSIELAPRNQRYKPEGTCAGDSFDCVNSFS